MVVTPASRLPNRQNAIGTGVLGGMISATVLVTFLVLAFFAFVLRGKTRTRAEVLSRPCADRHCRPVRIPRRNVARTRLPTVGLWWDFRRWKLLFRAEMFAYCAGA